VVVVVVSDGGVAGAVVGLMRLITNIASNSGATTASPTRIAAGGAPLRLCLGLVQEAQLVSPQSREFFRARRSEQLPRLPKVLN
jgi:hypothetical protein